MNEYLAYIQQWWRPMVEIAILTIAIYYILIFVRGTRGWPVVIGFVVMLGLSFVSDLLKLQVLALFLQTFLAASAFAALVIFQPELRRMLDRYATRLRTVVVVARDAAGNRAVLRHR